MTEVERLLGEVHNARSMKEKELNLKRKPVTSRELEAIDRHLAYLDDQISLRCWKLFGLREIQ